jgi:hypothetical protein
MLIGEKRKIWSKSGKSPAVDLCLGKYARNDSSWALFGKPLEENESLLFSKEAG